MTEMSGLTPARATAPRALQSSAHAVASNCGFVFTASWFKTAFGWL